MTQAYMPRDWNESEQLDGYDFINKAELLNAPFRIQAVEFYLNSQGVRFVNVEAEDVRRVPFTFNDSSTGVQTQLWEWIAVTRCDGGEPELGTIYKVSLVAPRGLRESVYGIDRDGRPVPADSPTAVRKARTYYLTTNGKGRAAETPSAPATPTAKAPAKAKAPRPKAPAVRASSTSSEVPGDAA